jgi:hypothetical protein
MFSSPKTLKLYFLFKIQDYKQSEVKFTPYEHFFYKSNFTTTSPLYKNIINGKYTSLVSFLFLQIDWNTTQGL